MGDGWSVCALLIYGMGIVFGGIEWNTKLCSLNTTGCGGLWIEPIFGSLSTE